MLIFSQVTFHIEIFEFSANLTKKDTSKVSILTKVTLTNLVTKKQVTYQIVSEKEADLKLGKISVTSPIGRGLLGKAIGETTEVQVPAGMLKFKIENITL